MGIPRLMQGLGPYGRRNSWVAGTDSEYPGMVVDGPAFAYFIYGRVQARSRSKAGLPFDLVPMYEDVAAEALQYLQTLELIGFKVRNIYFDGYLPASKRNIRLERWHHSLAVKIRLRQAFPTSVGTYGVDPPLEPLSRRSRVELPKPPFLVPVIFEALRTSEFGTVTETVAAEADNICAQRSTDEDLILTNDTDLILHKSKGKIAFFSDCYLTTTSESPEGKPSFECTLFAPLEISERLRCPDLVKLAFLMVERPYKTLLEYARLVRDDELSLAELRRFGEFKQPYELHLPCSGFPLHLASKNLESNLKAVLASLDARVSEVVHASLGSTGEISEVVEVCLPPLLDDPTHSSAWIPSRTIRKLIYPLLNRRAIKHQRFSELDRSGQDSLSFNRFEEHMPDGTLLEGLTSLVSDLERFLLISRKTNAYFSGDSKDNIYAWRTASLLCAFKAMRSHGTALPSLDTAERVIGMSKGDWTWTHAHLSATVEGVIYSLRMLKQVMQLFLALQDVTSSPSNAAIVSTTRDMLALLDDMPPLSMLLSKSSWVLSLGELESEFISIAKEEYGLARERSSTSKAKGRRTQHKKTKRDGKRAFGAMEDTGNYYHLLSTHSHPED